MIFSVVIPAKNEELNIGRCLDSIRAVAFDPRRFEVIVVDNGSNDDTVAVSIRKGATVYVKPGLTVSALRNFGAARSSGRVLAFIDADCSVAPSWLAEAERYLEREDIVCFGSPPAPPKDATWVQRAWFSVRRKKRAAGETSWLESMNMFVRREAFTACGGFDETLVTCEDYDLSLRLRARGMLYADEAIAATHYGEAETLRHFFKKELWRGIGNLRGALRHGVKGSELPSLMLPFAHWFSFAAPVACFVVAGSAAPGAFLFFAWQALILSLCIVKYRRAPLRLVPQIFVLLNVYYLARGAACLRRS